MATINEFSIWEPNIYELETTDLVIGGPSGISNLSRQQLTNRTRKIYDVLVENGIFITEGDHEFVGQNIDVTAVFEGSVVDGNVVWYDNPQSRYEKAQAATGGNDEHFVGIADVTNGRVISGGLITVSIPGGNVGDIAYLSSTTPGLLTVTPSNVPVGKILWYTAPSVAVMALNSGVGGTGGGGFDPEQDTYRMLLNDSFYNRGSWDNFENEDLVDGGNTDADFNIVDQLYEYTNGEDVVSINLRDPLASGNVTEAYLSVNLEGSTPQLWLSANGGANWEAVSNNASHTFANPGTDLRIWFRGVGSGILKSWGVLYEASSAGPVVLTIAHSDLVDDEPDRHITPGQSFGEGVGTIIAVPTEVVPPNYLECNGAAISQTTYSDLFAVLGFRSGNPGGGNFNLPDYRGAFLRGWAHGFSRDPDRNLRIADKPGGNTADNVGSFQDDEFESHRHAPQAGYADFMSGTGNTHGQGGDAYGTFVNTAFTGGNETRPKNIYVMFCIKYQD